MSAQRQRDGAAGRPVLVSNTAANMISSLHPYDKAKAEAVLARITSGPLDPSTAVKVAGVDDAYITRTGNLRVVFKIMGDTVVITSVVTKAE